MLPMDSLRTSIALEQVSFQVISQRHAKLKTTLDVFTATVNASLLHATFM